MKKGLLILPLLFIGMLSASAQISITTADVALPGQVVHQASDTLPTISVGTASASSQVWNFSSLAQHVHDTLSFMSYASVPNSNFTSSNLVIKQGWRANYGYAINSTSSVEQLGVSGIPYILGYYVPVTQITTPAETLATFPFTYNSTFTNTYRSKAKFHYGHVPAGAPITVDSIRDHSTTKKTVVVDAWGTLTTPIGTYNVIRSKEKKIIHDTVDVFYTLLFTSSWHNNYQNTTDSTTTYNWWANGLGYILATATMDSTSGTIVRRVDWSLSAPVGVGVPELTIPNSELVYPNPAENEINFIADATNQKAIQIFDIAGRLIDTITVTNNQTIINTSGYSNGMYMYNVIGKDNSILTKGKFAIINR